MPRNRKEKLQDNAPVEQVSSAQQDIYFQNQSTYQEWRLRATLDVYPVNDELSTYVNSLWQRMSKGKKKGAAKPGFENISITVYKDAANAFVFPNGSVYISDRLLQMCDTEEEIFFVLKHEYNHYIEEHSKQAHDVIETTPEERFVEAMLGLLATSRLNEWSSDLSAFVEMNELGYNPLAGISIFTKLLSSSGYDVVHGDMADRIRILKALISAKHLENLDAPQTAVPIDLKNVIENDRTTRYERLITSLKREHYWDTIQEIAEKNHDGTEIRFMDLNQSLNFLMRLQHDINENEDAIKTSTSTKDKNELRYKSEFIKEIIPHVARSIWLDIQDTYLRNGYALTVEQITYLFYTVLNLVAGVPLEIPHKLKPNYFFDNTAGLEITDTSRSTIPWKRTEIGLEFLMIEPENIDTLLSCLNPSVLKSLNLVVNHKPEQWVKNAVQAAINVRTLLELKTEKINPHAAVAFTKDLLSRLETLYDKQGTAKLDTTLVTSAVTDVISLNTPNETEFNEFMTVFAAEFQTATVEKKHSQEVDPVARALLTLEYTFVDEFAAHQNEVEKQRGIKGGSTADWSNPKIREEITAIVSQTKITSREQLLEICIGMRFLLQQEAERLLQYANTAEINPKAINFLTFTASYAHIDFLETFIDVCKSRTQLFSADLDSLLYEFKLYAAFDDITTVAINHFVEELANKNIGSNPDFNYEWYKKFMDVYNNPQQVFENTHLHVNKESSIDKIIINNDEQAVFAQIKYSLLRNSFNNNYSEFRVLLRQFTDEFPPDRHDFYNDNVNEEFLREVFSTHQFDLDNRDDILDLYHLSFYLFDPILRTRFNNVVLNRIGTFFDFTEHLDFMVNEAQQKRLPSSTSLLRFIREKANTFEEIEKVESESKQFIGRNETKEEFGRFIINKEVGLKEISLLFENSQQLLEALTDTDGTDKKLKTYLYEWWKNIYHFFGDAPLFINLDDIRDRLYRLDGQGKFLLVKEILVGDNGILTGNAEKHDTFINYFADTLIVTDSETDKKGVAELKKILKKLLLKGDPDTIYFILRGFLENAVLAPPQVAIPWSRIIYNSEPPNEFGELSGVFIPYTKSGSKFTYHREKRVWPKNRKTKEEIQQIVYLSTYGKSDSSLNPEESLADAEVLQIRKEYEKLVYDIILKEEPIRIVDKLSLSDVIFKAAQSISALGIRFLQVRGQFIQIGEHLDDQDMSAYDAVDTETKVTAKDTLFQIWPAARNVLTGLHRYLGGGALMGVYTTKLRHPEPGQEEREFAIKIPRANARHRTVAVAKLLKTVFMEMASESDEYALEYQMASTAIDEIVNWTKQDIKSANFIQNDELFRSTNEGFTATYGKWPRQKRTVYSITVPQSYDLPTIFGHEPEVSARFIFEDMVDGKNLTARFEELKREGHNVKEIVYVVISNFIHQIKTGLFHPDLHRGNIRLVEGTTKIAILDRNFLLKLTLKDQLFLKDLASMVDNTDKLVSKTVDYLVPEQEQMPTVGDLNTFKREISTVLETVPNSTQRLMKFSVLLRHYGFKIPLKLTLIINDYNYLDKMAQTAGFQGFQDALKYDGKR